MSSADSAKWKQISAALEQAFNVDVLRGVTATSIGDTPDTTPTAPIDNKITSQQVPQASRMQAAIQAVLDHAQQQGTQQTPQVSVGTDTQGIVVRLSGSYLFDSGRAELKPNSFDLLDAIAQQLKLEPNDIRVDGHTDSTLLVGSALYPTNWELSAARAVAVTRYFAESGGIPATRLQAAGFGEFRPLVPNDTREHRAMNRRVEIHLLNSVPPDASADQTVTTPTPQPTGATEYLEP
jgi:chemotaxis protein MotB